MELRVLGVRVRVFRISGLGLLFGAADTLRIGALRGDAHSRPPPPKSDRSFELPH